MPTRDTKEYKNLFEYKNHTVYDDMDEHQENDGKLLKPNFISEFEFSDLMSEQNRTCQIDSLADELEFYDQADDDFGNDSGIYQSEEQIQDPVIGHDKLKPQAIDYQAPKQVERKNTGNSSDIANYML